MLPDVVASRIPVLMVAAALLASPAAIAERVDRVVSIVGERVVTESDLALAIELTARDSSVVPALVVTAEDALQRLEEQRLVREQAGQVRLYQPTRRALQARLDAVRRTFPAPGEWEAYLTRWGLTEDTLRIVLLNRMVVEHAVLRTLGTPTGPDDDDWHGRYETWLEELRSEASIYRPEPIP